MRDEIKEHSSSFISKLYSYDDIPRSRVDTILEDCSSLMKQNISLISGHFTEKLRVLGEAEENIEKFEVMLNAVVLNIWKRKKNLHPSANDNYWGKGRYKTKRFRARSHVCANIN